MSNRDRMVVTKNVVANIAVAGVFAVGAAVALAATAAADPPPGPPAIRRLPRGPPADPAAPPPGPLAGDTMPLIGAPLGPTGLSVLAQNGAPAAGPFGIPEVPDPHVGDALMLGQNPVPSPPGGPPGTPPKLDALNNAYLLPQNVVPRHPAKERCSGWRPADKNADLGRIDYLKHLHALYSDGRLKGALLSQMPRISSVNRCRVPRRLPAPIFRWGSRHHPHRPINGRFRHPWCRRRGNLARTPLCRAPVALSGGVVRASQVDVGGIQPCRVDLA